MEFSCKAYIVVTIVLMCVGENAASFWNPPDISDYADHPCRRDCLRTTPMVCKYNFTVEHYQTLSRACYNCPYNMSDCSRPHCIPADGFLRAIKVVNRMMPGPALHVCKGDTLLVNVYNQLSDFEGTAIHWHGILQEGTPHMDGVAMVTQCPIPTHSVFQYRFNAQNSGTHYWHAHAGLQRGDGIFGALIVRDTSVTSVKSLYDEDLPEHTVLIQDWLDQYSSAKFALHHHGMSDNQPSSILINGKGTTFGHGPKDSMQHGGHSMDGNGDDAMQHGGHSSGGTNHDPVGDMGGMGDMGDTMNKTGNMKHNDTTVGMQHTTVTTAETTHGAHGDHMTGTTTHGAHGDHMTGTTTMPMNDHDMTTESTDAQKAFVPHTVFRVQRGRRYRFRLISNGILNCPFKVSVEKHTLTVIASDGNDMLPTEVDSITIFAGERYDVVLIANQFVGNYWMHVVGLGDCEINNTSQTAIIRYEGAMKMKPTTGSGYADGERTGRSGNPMVFDEDMVTVADMKSETTPHDVYTAHNVHKFYMNLGYNEVENYHFLDANHYPLAEIYQMHKGSHGNHLFALQMNDITFKMPMSPVLTQYRDLDEEIFCNETSVPGSCHNDFCECVHRVKVDLDAVVELVLISNGIHGPGNHPMHLHGHAFYILGMEKLNTTISRSTIEDMDRRGILSRNLENPIKKDTVMVPDGGYTIIRFRAKNPGFWLFHCHVDFHFALGMSIVLQVGEIRQMRSAPGNFPKCGSWHYTEDATPYDMCSDLSNHGNSASNNQLYTVLLLSLWWYIFSYCTK